MSFITISYGVDNKVYQICGDQSAIGSRKVEPKLIYSVDSRTRSRERVGNQPQRTQLCGGGVRSSECVVRSMWFSPSHTSTTNAAAAVSANALQLPDSGSTPACFLSPRHTSLPPPQPAQVWGPSFLLPLVKLFRLRNIGNFGRSSSQSKSPKSKSRQKSDHEMKHEMSASELKDEGNRYFTIHKYDEAIVSIHLE